MIHEFANVPATRSWRDIPQPVKPRAMSAGGRRRLMRTAARTVLGSLFAAGLIWGGWLLTDALRENSARLPAVARTAPVRAPELKTNGVLSQDWLARQLALPRGASLMELDLDALHGKLLADGQVQAATLARHFPDRLLVTITERSPVAKVMADWKGVQQPLLVARDGMIFLGEGHPAALVDHLPWLDGITIGHRDGRFLPIAGMPVVTELLAKANEADALATAGDPRRIWRVVSLARLEADREIEVRTAAGTTVVFAANGDFFGQLAKLDFLWDALASAASPPARIDLTLGREVPVMVEPGSVATDRPVQLSPLLQSNP